MAPSPLESRVGYLVPLNKKLAVDDLVQRIPVLPGNDNVVGRDQLSVVDKRVSRKQIRLCVSSDGRTELVVEGQNPIILFSGGQRKKICSGDRVPINYNDIIELIPGSFSFKFVEPDNENNLLSSRKEAMSAGKVKRALEEDASTAKRNRRISPNEASSRTLQHEEICSTTREAYVDTQSSLVSLSQDGAEPIHHFRVSSDILPLLFRLMRVQGLPSWANTSSVSIEDVIQGDVLVAILSNYMVDLEWLLSACPALKKLPHVLVVHGESGARTDYLKKKKPEHWVLHKPPLPISYGTHHTKAMVLIYTKGVRIIVHTANLIYVDWNNKSQGLWMQDFPWKNQFNPSNSSPFENDLIDYLSTLKLPEFKVNLPSVGNVSINASFFKKFDYSTAVVRLIASVPGYHTGSSLKRWGHMKLRTVLEECVFDKEYCKSPLIYQFSSLGSLDEKWLAELALSMSAGFTEDKAPLGLGKPLIIWPTVEDVRCSLEGYAAGNAIPSPQKNVEKEFLKKYWARWKASHTGRCRAMPHIKSYTRYNGQNLAWFLLTSANLSKAAWGSLQKNNSQIMIRSYELGVLFLPVSVHRCRQVFSCTDDSSPSQGGQRSSVNADERKLTLTTLCWAQNKMTDPSSTEVLSLPLPYEIPPKPYTAEDVPWSWDRRYTKKDVYGEVWPRHVQLYTDEG